MARRIIVLLALLCGLSSCGTGIYVPDADAYTTNPFKYTTLKSTFTVQKTWDEALAPLPCTALKNIGKTWFIEGRVVANGLVYKDQPLKDPTAVAAIGQKFARHIGPGC